MTKVLARKHCLPLAPARLQLLYGKENLLDDLHSARPAGGFSVAALVGPGLDRSYPLRLMVGRLPQRLVLNSQLHVADWVMVKLPLVSLHPVGVPLPVNVQVPVITPPVSVVPFGPPGSVPVTFPVRVRVLPPD